MKHCCEFPCQAYDLPLKCYELGATRPLVPFDVWPRGLHGRFTKLLGLALIVSRAVYRPLSFPWGAFYLQIRRFGDPCPARQSSLHSFFAPNAAGPDAEAVSDSCVFAVVNPTSILHKVPALMELQADVIALSETSAVHRAQTVTTSAFRKHAYKVHWGQSRTLVLSPLFPCLGVGGCPFPPLSCGPPFH